MSSRSPADGYTLLLVAAANTINTSLYPNLNFDFVRDIAPVASIGGVIFLMAVNPSVPAKTAPELIAYAKANPGQDQFGFARHRLAHSRVRRIVQDDGRR